MTAIAFNAKGRPASLFVQLAPVLIATIACGACTSDRAVRGRFYWGHEVRSFQPCGSKNTYWVRADRNTLQALRERAERLRAQQGKPYPELYIEAVGTIDAKPKREGFARDYDGLFDLREVTGVSDLVPKDCG